MPQLPLFPLHTVLFPGGALPLLVFEPRYREMIGRCLEEDAELGVVLLKEGEEVGEGPQVPYDVGTTARIVESERLPDGRLQVLVRGRRRFRIAGLDRTRTYLVGDVAPVEDEHDDALAEQARAGEVRRLFERYYRMALAVTDQWTAEVRAPRDPARLADYVGQRLEVDPAVKQALLEEQNVLRRLVIEAEVIEVETDRLEQRLRVARAARFGTLGALN